MDCHIIVTTNCAKWWAGVVRQVDTLELSR